MSKHSVPPGHVLIRVEDLAALVASHTRAPSPPPAMWPALAASVALIANELDRTGASSADLTDGVPAEEINRMLTLIVASALKVATADRGADLLRALGLLAATQAGSR